MTSAFSRQLAWTMLQLCTRLPPKPDDRADIWKDIRKKVESHGMKFNNVGLRPAKEITLGKPGRDEHIEGWCTLIRNMGEAGVPTLCYNFRGIGNFRTDGDRRQRRGALQHVRL